MRSKKQKNNVENEKINIAADTPAEDKRQFRLEQILAETRYITERDAMKKAAEKYGARPEMDEIFSNANKKVRLTNSNPLEIDNKKEDENEENNAIQGEKNAATMQAELIMDSDDENRVINLTPEIPEGAEIAEDVIEESPVFSEVDPEIGTMFGTADGTLDILKDKPSDKNSYAGNYEKKFGVKKPAPDAKTVRSKVPVYKQDSEVEKLHVKAGRFSEVVKGEYEQYLRSKNPSISQVIKTEMAKVETITPEGDTRSKKEKVLSAVVGIFSNDNSDDSDLPVDQVVTVDDYTGPEDSKSILYELNLNIKRLFVRSVLMSIITFIQLVITIIVGVFPEAVLNSVANAPVVYAIINLLFTGVVIFVNRITIYSGLTPLVKLRGNSDTALAVASIAMGLQSLVSLFRLAGATEFEISFYGIIVSFGFLCNCIGKLMMVLRIKDNFKFVSSKAGSNAVKIYTNEEIAKKMMSGAVTDRPIIAYHHKTNFLSNFLKISYAPDPSEDLAGKIAPITSICSLLVAIMYGIMHTSFVGGVDTLSVMTAVSIPICTLLAVNLPMRMLCKGLNSQGAMVAGYPSVKQFCDTNAVMIDSTDLYPEGTVKLDGIKTFANHRTDESVLAAAAILREAGSPMASVFNRGMLSKERNADLPDVETVLYEDGMGLVGRVNGQRVLVGNRTLMHKYNIDTPSEDYEEKYLIEGRRVTYLAQQGELISMFVTTYTPDREIAEALQKGEQSGLGYLIRTTDCNITAERIAEDFALYYRSIKILPTGLGNVCKEAQSQVEDKSRAYLGTRGNISSMVRGVAGCIRIKGNISLAIVIQLIALILGLLLVATLCLYADNAVVGTLQILIYSLFWSLAAMLSPLIQRL
ncbi:MAG: cation-translocating P-type ATPase [Ruminococcus sp.]|nr:cation-translocating P-type ATPase [Ruminococcus sp.]